MNYAVSCKYASRVDGFCHWIVTDVYMFRVEFLRKKANRQLALARQANSNGKKDEALHNLKRKKVIEKEVNTLESRYFSDVVSRVTTAVSTAPVLAF